MEMRRGHSKQEKSVSRLRENNNIKGKFERKPSRITCKSLALAFQSFKPAYLSYFFYPQIPHRNTWLEAIQTTDSERTYFEFRLCSCSLSLHLLLPIVKGSTLILNMNLFPLYFMSIWSLLESKEKQISSSFMKYSYFDKKIKVTKLCIKWRMLKF